MRGYYGDVIVVEWTVSFPVRALDLRLLSLCIVEQSGQSAIGPALSGVPSRSWNRERRLANRRNNSTRNAPSR